MLVKQIKQNEDFLVDEILAGLEDDRGLTIWRNFIRRTRPYEIKFTKVLQGLFRGQEREVIANMRAHPRAVNDAIASTELVGYLKGYTYGTITELRIKQNWLSRWPFAEMMWRKRFSNNGKPFIGGVLETVGSAELTELISGVDFDIDNPRVQAFINSNADKYSFYTNQATIDQLRKQLIAGVKLGESIPELTKRVNKVFQFAEKYRATRIARSEMIRSGSAGAEFAYTQSGVCKGKEWLISADACELCVPMSGKKAGLGKSFNTSGIDANLDYTEGEMPYPPLHPNCRCTIIAILIGD